MPKQGATITGVKGLGLQLKGTAPANSNKLIRKDELNNWYYVDNVAAGISSYPDNRIMTYEDLIGATFVKPAVPFYEYDVTRSSIPGAMGRYFTYVGSNFQTYTIQQDAYGYVGRFCMQEGSYINNDYGVYTISLIGVCYPYYGDYPQPYISGCCLYFNNLGSYTVSDVKIYQLIRVENVKQNWTTILGSLSFLAAVPGVNILWGAASLLVIAGGEIYNNDPGSKLSNQLRYTGTGNYTNGGVCLSTVGSPLGTPQYYIAYKVKNPQGTVVANFGYNSGESNPPGFTSSCVGSGTGTSTAAIWTSTGTTACVSCANVTVYRDTNAFSSTSGKYKVGTNGTVVTTDPSTAACVTTANWVLGFGTQYCTGCTKHWLDVDVNPCSATSGETRVSSYVEYDSTYCEGCCGQSTTADWTIAFSSYSCLGCDKYYNEIDLNTCSATYGNVRRSGVLSASNSTYCEGCCGQSTAADWTILFGSYSCNGCDKYYNEVDLNTCSSTSGQVRRSSALSAANSTYCGGCCGASTTQVWTATGNVRCQDCVSQIEQQQTNSCASNHNGLRWVSGGAHCNTTANYSIADGTYWTCDGEGNTTANTIYRNSTTCFTGNQWSLLGTTYATKPTENTEPSVAQNWVPSVDVNGYCIGGDYYQPQVQVNPCAVNFGGTRDYLLEANSSACNEMYVLYNCADGSTGYSSVYAAGTFMYNQRVTSNGVTYRIINTGGANLAGSIAITSTGEFGCPPAETGCIQYNISSAGYVQYTDCMGHDYNEYLFSGAVICATSISTYNAYSTSADCLSQV